METMSIWTPEYSKWRHGGWYTNVRYPSGACGCVSNNYANKKWRIVCDPRPFETAPTFKTRDAAARGEKEYVEQNWEALKTANEAFLESLKQKFA